MASKTTAIGQNGDIRDILASYASPRDYLSEKVAA